MIRSICLNPVIDRTYFIDDFKDAKQYKEITPLICSGGKGVNIAKVVSALSEECTLYGFVGGWGGQLIRKEMESLGVTFRCLETPGETRTTINIIDGKNRRETEMIEKGEAVSPQQEEELLQILQQDILTDDIVICSGIPMTGMTKGIYKIISSWCRRKGAKCVLDTNSRYLPESLPAHYNFMKPNLSELMELYGIHEFQNDSHLVSLAKQTLNLGIENLLVSAGCSGGFFFNAAKSLRVLIPNLPAVSTVGSGDSTVAGFCVAAQRGLPIEDCLKFSMACGICNAMSPKIGYVEKETVEKLARQVLIKPL